MKLPIPFLLHATALGLCTWAGWTIYRMLPQLAVVTGNTYNARGYHDAVQLMAQGKRSGPIAADWR